MARNTYTDEDKARAFVTLTANGGNIKRTAREVQMPVPTLRAWRDEWNRTGGPPASQLDAVQAEADGFIREATQARDLALAKWHEAVEAGDVKGKDLMVGVGILTDKINLAKGLKKAPAQQQLVSGDDVREIAKQFIAGALDAAHERQREIAEAESDPSKRVIEQAPRALSPA